MGTGTRTALRRGTRACTTEEELRAAVARGGRIYIEAGTVINLTQTLVITTDCCIVAHSPECKLFSTRSVRREDSSRLIANYDVRLVVVAEAQIRPPVLFLYRMNALGQRWTTIHPDPGRM